jgi:hypothetical protein
MPTEKYIEPLHLSLKNSREYDEKWLQSKIYDNPDILGIANGLSPIDIERRQHNGGRLDLLLEDSESDSRYTVELQLGATDEAHIIRTIEYWDNERARNPHIEHTAVIVAEDITTRFLNVIQLFNKSIPLIAIQLRAYRVGDALTLIGTKVLDLRKNVGEDLKLVSQPADRNYWAKKNRPELFEMADEVLSMVKEIAPDNKVDFNYTKPYIGFYVDGIADTFVTLRPRANPRILIEFNKVDAEKYAEELKEALENECFKRITKWGSYVFVFDKKDFAKYREMIVSLVKIAAEGSRIG